MLASGFLKMISARSKYSRHTPQIPRGPLTLLPALLAVLFAGVACSGPYLQNRWQDSKDVFTATVETESYGGALRLGPVKAGLNYKAPGGGATGLRGGKVGEHESADFAAFFFGADYFSDTPIRFDGWKPESAGDAESDAGADDLAANFAAGDAQSAGAPGQANASAKGAIRSTSPVDAADTPVETVDASAFEQPVLRLRDKLFRALSPFGTEKPAHKSQSLLKDDDTDWAPAYYFTQAELQLGAYLGVRLGWNAGETFDWLVGWFGFDPLGDDAPYGESIEEQLEQYPFWNTLSEEEKDAIRERLQQGGGAGGLFLGP